MDEKRKRSTAYIGAHGRMHWLGDYLTEAEAIKARKDGEVLHWGTSTVALIEAASATATEAGPF